MKIDGRQLQKEILFDLENEIIQLKNSRVTPGIAIITLGDEETWKAYVGQKIKLADKLGVNKKLITLDTKSTLEVQAVIEELNKDTSVHGLIVQRPFPPEIETEKVIQTISKEKDIDGFQADSLFEVPVWLAVKHVITYIAYLINEANIQNFLSNQSILIVGRGETAGKPTINALQKLGFQPQVIDSKTGNRDQLFSEADVIISAVGKSNVIPIEKLKKESILIGIGLHREDGKLVGDFDEDAAKDRVAFYTPSPGGIGPLNLAYLFKNLITATKIAVDKREL